MKVSTGTIVDATIINAPSSTKNQDKARDPEMHQTKKGNQWYFGMKAHIGVDSQTKLIHSVVATPANVHDKHAIPQLLHGNERRVYGDSAIKRIFGFAKVSYRGMLKNGNRLFVVAALANLFMARHHLLRLPQERCV
jgi:IS5 family transposase